MTDDEVNAPAVGRRGVVSNWDAMRPKPREGDDLTPARSAINMAAPEAREATVARLREQGVPLPDGPLPTGRGWLDCWTGEVNDPSETDGRRFV